MDRYVAAFERYDVDALTALLHEDATVSMPPYTLWLRGHEAIHAWLSGRGAGCRGSRLLPAAACGSPAFGQYRPAPEGGHHPWALIVLELSGDRIASRNAGSVPLAAVAKSSIGGVLPEGGAGRASGSH